MGSDHPDLSDSLSAVMDGEADQEETKKVIQGLVADPNLRQRWQQYESISSHGKRWSNKGSSKKIRVENWDELAEHYKAQSDLTDNVPDLDTQPLPPVSSKLQWQMPRPSLALAASIVLIAFFGSAIYFNLPNDVPHPFLAQDVEPEFVNAAHYDELDEIIVEPQYAGSPEYALGLINAHESVDRKRAEVGLKLLPHSVLVSSRQLSTPPYVYRRVAAK